MHALPPFPSLIIVGNKMARLLPHSFSWPSWCGIVPGSCKQTQIQWLLNRQPAVTTEQRTRGREASSSPLLSSCFRFRYEFWSSGNLLVTKRQAQSPIHPSKLESRKMEKLGSMCSQTHTRNQTVPGSLLHEINDRVKTDSAEFSIPCSQKHS